MPENKIHSYKNASYAIAALFILAGILLGMMLKEAMEAKQVGPQVALTIAAGVLVILTSLYCHHVIFSGVASAAKLNEYQEEDHAILTHALAFSAMCAWEWVIERTMSEAEDDRVRDALQAYRELVGTCQMRSDVVELVPFIEDAYERAVCRGFDGSFDWEFVPHFMELGVNWSDCTPIDDYEFVDESKINHEHE